MGAAQDGTQVEIAQILARDASSRVLSEFERDWLRGLVGRRLGKRTRDLVTICECRCESLEWRWQPTNSPRAAENIRRLVMGEPLSESKPAAGTARPAVRLHGTGRRRDLDLE